MNLYNEEFVLKLKERANEYIEECLENTVEKATASGQKVKIKDRHIPTIQFFLNIWLPIIKKDKSISRKTWYNWINAEIKEENSEEQNELIKLKLHTIKEIDKVFSSLATDIVANEGKGIFYAKNKLGMTDKIDKTIESKSNLTITGMQIINEEEKEEEDE